MKNIRLPLNLYSLENQPCMITICSTGIITIFNNHEFARFSIQTLENLCDRFSFNLYCYCFMPDHVHFIASVQREKSLLELIAMFKSLTTLKGRELLSKNRIYQPRFYDHFIRSEKELTEKANYIIENPVRKGLVENWRDFPFSFLNL